ncbi:Fic family protein [Sphingomonas morindae]|uniref:Fic family protein n=1 Tax=Sphingomonas morindae TaxID=1541170 RepID=A0ABY4XE95_9SPHN|nr:Fic family protein [Sphingomonas morindae]USI75101.1 Fic family protein [Sphingomonas morindae]
MSPHTAPPEWQAYTMPDYHAAMTKACTALLQRIHADAAFRLSILTDPRDLHRTLFAQFTPRGHPEYAGTYRGTVGTSLEGRRSGAPQLFTPQKSFSFEEPENVAAQLDFMLAEVRRELVPARSAAPYVQLLTLTHLFCWFGKIHPFLDGNGHIQRALFAAAAVEIGIPLAARFAIHPRPFDSLLAWPLEAFTRASADEREPFIGMVAEYLSSWLAGPFDQPASGIAPEDDPEAGNDS